MSTSSEKLLFSVLFDLRVAQKKSNLNSSESDVLAFFKRLGRIDIAGQTY